MRVGPFSHPQIINLLNRCFVPVYTSNEDYRVGGAKESERDLLLAIWNEAEQKELPCGTVHVYILDFEGHVTNSMHVRDSAQPERLFAMLGNAVRTLQVEPGETLIEPKQQRRPPAVGPDSLLLYFLAEEDGAQSIFVEDWVELRQPQWQQFVPHEGIALGEAWAIDDEVTQRIFNHVYPYAADWDVSRHEFSQKELSAYVLHREESKQIVALRGHVKMRHNRQPGADSQPLDAEIVGYVEIVPGEKPRVRLTTGMAYYGGNSFHAMVQDVPSAVAEELGVDADADSSADDSVKVISPRED